MNATDVAKGLGLALNLTNMATSFILRMKAAIETGGEFDVEELVLHAQALDEQIQAIQPLEEPQP